MKTLPFNIVAALAGAAVVNSQGTPVKVIAWVPNEGVGQPVVFIHQGKVETAYEDGTYQLTQEPSVMDLRLVDNSCNCHQCSLIRQAKADRDALGAYIQFMGPSTPGELISTHATLSQLIDLVEEE